MKAFPTESFDFERQTMVNEEGMDLRDYFAAKAMQQFMIVVSNDPRDITRLGFDIANMSYQIADAMLEARKQHD